MPYGHLAIRRILADLERAEANVDRLTRALVEAAVPLEVLGGQIAVKPYKELTADFQNDILLAVRGVRSAFAALEKP